MALTSPIVKDRSEDLTFDRRSLKYTITWASLESLRVATLKKGQKQKQWNSYQSVIPIKFACKMRQNRLKRVW